MIKYLGIAILMLLVAGSWYKFYESGDEGRTLREQVYELESMGDPKEEVPALKVKMRSIEGQRVFSGILLCFLSAGLVGIVFVTQVLPVLAHKMTHAVYDS